MESAVRQMCAQVLQQVFGYPGFRPLQGDVVEHVAEGGSALVLMPTGGGKSLCYQVPALVRSGTAVVISPLIALMDDQIRALQQAGVQAACLHSGLDTAAIRAVETSLLDGRLDLVYCAPERLLGGRMLNLLERVELALFAVDEAHCVSQWGHDFRPEYLQLSELRERFPDVPMVALTATADRRTRDEIAERLAMPDARRFVGSFDRPNIRYRIGLKQQPQRQLIEFIRREHPGEAGIVYCLSRKRVEDTALFLHDAGLTALPYHAGLPVEVRARHQARFLNEDGIVMVATIAFGMGIDKPDVRFVAHLDLPRSLEAYYQETGRAGRDGQPAEAWLVYGLSDVAMLRQLLADSSSSDARKHVERARLEAMLAYCETTDCRRRRLLGYFDEVLEADCGNCDICLSPPQTWDATEAARMALSCVYRTGQRFGVGYLIGVLRGQASTRSTQLGHDRLSVWGLGAAHSEATWRAVFRQLLAFGFLDPDSNGHGGLRLSEQCRALLRGEERLTLRRDVAAAIGAGGSRPAPPEPAQQVLWDALRTRRRELALSQGVPPYVVFNDATLRAMLERRPTSLEAFAQLPGVGERKRDRYGEAFLAVLRRFHGEHG